MITLNDYITADGKYPERLKSFELNAEKIKNAIELLKRVNAMLAHLKIDTVKVSSGFRPSGVNAALPNSAKRSAHMTCEAVDLVDPDGDLDALFTRSLLEKFDLYREDSDYTVGWSHIQSRRTPSGKRIFKP